MVEGHLYFKDLSGYYAVFLLSLALVCIAILIWKTPTEEVPPLNRAQRKLGMDLALVTLFSFITSGYVLSIVKNPLLVSICMGGYAAIPTFYIMFTSRDFSHFGYGGVNLQNLLLGVAFALATTIITKSYGGLRGSTQPLQSVPFFGELPGISFKTLPLVIIGLAGAGTQNLLFQCQQSLIQDIFGRNIKGLIIFIIFSTILLWFVYEPLNFPIQTEELLNRWCGNLIGIVLMALLYYKTNSLFPPILYHIIGNVLVWFPSMP